MPEAILLKDVETLGEKGTVVDVSKGYLRNYLIPRKLAQPATKGAVDAAQRRAAAEERAAQEAVGRAAEQAELLNKTVLTISQQAGDDGRLFGSVTTQDIADAIQEARGIAIDRRKIHLDEPIKHVGTYMGDVPDLGDQPPALDREAAQPRELPDQDGDGDPVQVAELHRARQQLGHEPQPGHAGDQDEQPGEDGEGAGQSDRRPGVGAAEGQDHGRDHRGQRRVGPEHHHPRRPEDGVDDRCKHVHHQGCR